MGPKSVRNPLFVRPCAAQAAPLAARETWPHHAIADIAALQPDNLAVAHGDASLTYGQLAGQARQLAATLRRHGVGPETLVALGLPRSIARIVALLAISLAGGAVLPLDPTWPDQRLRTILHDAGALLTIGTAALGARLGPDFPLLAPDASSAACAPTDAPAGLPPDQLAYVIYTSGSTGTPNGVEITQGNLRHLIDWHMAAFALTADDRVSHVAGLGFDAAMWEIWPALCAGATLVLADDATAGSAARLQAWLAAQAVTIAFVPTILAETIIAASWPANTALRVLLTGGDVLHTRPAAGLNFAVFNNYGLTECSVVATCGPVAASNAAGLPDIGRPIARTELHILDALGDPVAQGEVGELCFGGEGIGRGYRNRPELTAERFVQNRFDPYKGGRLLRTGDFGRRLPDGRIAFHGRADSQENIRGMRVEPEEVAAALARHPSLAACAVIGRDDTDRRRHLVAYVVPAPHSMPGSAELRDFLALSLPDGIIPAAFVQLETLPVTANGKLDKAALPAPSIDNILGAHPYRAPATPAEQRLAEIIGALINRPRIGADDNFFLLGGHSLLGTQLVLRVADAFGVELTLRQVFETQTVANLALAIDDLLMERVAQMSEAEVQQMLSD